MSVLTPMSKLEIVNAALLRLGHPRITSFSDGSAEAEVANGLYDVVKENALTGYFWKFATRQVELNEVTGDTLHGYTHVYDEPKDCVRIVTVKGGRPYERAQGQIYTDEQSPIVLEYIENVPESLFPPYFYDALIKQLSFEFSMALSEDVSRTQMFERQSVVGWRMASHKDSTTQPHKSLNTAIKSAISRGPLRRP